MINLTCQVANNSIGSVTKYTWNKNGIGLRNTKPIFEDSKYESIALINDGGSYICVVTYINNGIQVASNPLTFNVICKENILYFSLQSFMGCLTLFRFQIIIYFFHNNRVNKLSYYIEMTLQKGQ